MAQECNTQSRFRIQPEHSHFMTHFPAPHLASHWATPQCSIKSSTMRLHSHPPLRHESSAMRPPPHPCSTTATAPKKRCCTTTVAPSRECPTPPANPTLSRPSDLQSRTIKLLRLPPPRAPESCDSWPREKTYKQTKGHEKAQQSGSWIRFREHSSRHPPPPHFAPPSLGHLATTLRDRMLDLLQCHAAPLRPAPPTDLPNRAPKHPPLHTPRGSATCGAPHDSVGHRRAPNRARSSRSDAPPSRSYRQVTHTRDSSCPTRTPGACAPDGGKKKEQTQLRAKEGSTPGGVRRRSSLLPPPPPLAHTVPL